MSYLESLFSLSGKTAVVVGGTGELCGAMAITMAQAGAEVVLVGRSEEKANAKLELIKQAGGNGYFVAADVSSKASIESLLSTVIEKSGKCDILINGAGVNAATPFLEVPEEEYDRIFATNAKAVLSPARFLVSTFWKTKSMHPSSTLDPCPVLFPFHEYSPIQ